jgi:anti-sigma B factor antagonist
MDLAISFDPRPPEAVVTVAGELDCFTSRRLRELMEEAVDLGCLRVRLDLGGVSFVDASALGVIATYHRRLAEARGSLHVVACSPRFLRVCRLAGLDSALQLADAQTV